MEGPRAHLWLVVLTLLQLCRAEHVSPRWYAARLHDNQRPHSETINSEPNFSTTKPIIVTSPSNSIASEDYNEYVTSPLPPHSSFRPDFHSTRIPSSPPTFFPSERLPSSGVKNVIVTKPSVREAHTTPLPPLYEIQDNIHELHNQRQLDLHRQHQRAFANHPYVPYIAPLHPQDTEPKLHMLSEIPSHGQRQLSLQQQIEPLGQTFAPSLPVNNLFHTQTPSTPREISSTASTYDFTVPSSTLSPDTHYAYENPEHFVTNYHETPSSSHHPSSTLTQNTFSETPSTSIGTSPVQTYTERSTTRFSPASESSTSSTTILTSTQRNPTSRILTSKVTVVPSSTTGSTVPPCHDRVITSTPAITAGLHGSPIAFPLKIRVIAPSGSITNVNINPVSTHKPTTSRTTTTRKPTTKRTPKPKKNSYERCLDGCKKVKDPICAAPLSHVEIDPKTLKGFPSVCHMACHNSYRAIPYEKVIEGSCSKLRTRIRPVDSRTKLKHVELLKTQYFLDHGGPKTIIELTGDVHNHDHGHKK